VINPLSFLGPVANLAGTWLEGHVATKKAKVEANIVKIKSEATIKEKVATGEISWDIEQAKASAHSFKDEILTIIYSIPLVLAFVPGCEDIVKRGFAVLDECPDWYKLSLGVIISASFGMRGASKFMGRKK